MLGLAVDVLLSDLLLHLCHFLGVGLLLLHLLVLLDVLADVLVDLSAPLEVWVDKGVHLDWLHHASWNLLGVIHGLELFEETLLACGSVLEPEFLIELVEFLCSLLFLLFSENVTLG